MRTKSNPEIPARYKAKTKALVNRTGRLAMALTLAVPLSLAPKYAHSQSADNKGEAERYVEVLDDIVQKSIRASSYTNHLSFDIIARPLPKSYSTVEGLKHHEEEAIKETTKGFAKYGGCLYNTNINLFPDDGHFIFASSAWDTYDIKFFEPLPIISIFREFSQPVQAGDKIGVTFDITKEGKVHATALNKTNGGKAEIEYPACKPQAPLTS